MNIFVLDVCPRKSAVQQLDKHVVKMPLETAQLLCSVFDSNIAPYRRTHYNHPCAVWTRHSYGNFMWLVEHGLALCDEYSARYNRVHKSKAVIQWCKDNVNLVSFLKQDMTPHPKCVPDECKVADIVQSYRNYYITFKRSIASWKRNKPDWWK